jgi:hypothetical protein
MGIERREPFADCHTFRAAEESVADCHTGLHPASDFSSSKSRPCGRRKLLCKACTFVPPPSVVFYPLSALVRFFPRFQNKIGRPYKTNTL